MLLASISLHVSVRTLHSVAPGRLVQHGVTVSVNRRDIRALLQQFVYERYLIIAFIVNIEGESGRVNSVL